MTQSLRTHAQAVPSKPWPIFGFRPSSGDMDQVVTTISGSVRTEKDGVGLIVTPNIDHIQQLKRNPAFRSAYAHAEMILCDGFPVYYYALARGHDVHHITGCDLTARLLSDARIEQRHRLFFVVDSVNTANAVHQWAEEKGILANVETLIPPFGFGRNQAWCAMATAKIRAFSPSILIMAVGAAQSEIFVDQYRSELPPCWAICVGQAVKVELGLTQRAPRFIRSLHGEWFWRLLQEPLRLAPRYTLNSIAFIPSVLDDLRESRRSA